MAKKSKTDKKTEESKKVVKQEVKKEFQLKKQNKYLVKAFKESEYYNEDISNEELEERFNKFKQE
ncbi:hypothetical protein [Methanobrevibacter arboriphilus]|uniref:Uncharacterized protein n=1 Tax=Methanobrevibacter arboriphilus TaxID=39441 RepID=A0ACA8R436_METAZ|nr:hypothetical protein [Methanobrevibacter arboriphilus]BBL62426.1 hypothetical protein MarbSA_14660 [Methanobrevibacter arboriphilus]